MNARQARAKLAELKTSDDARAKVEHAKHVSEDAVAAERGRKDAEAHVVAVGELITRAVIARKSRTEMYYFSHHDAAHGTAYLGAIADVLRRRYTKLGYKLEVEVKYNSAAVYDGSLMNPEVIDYEYAGHTLIAHVSWEVG